MKACAKCGEQLEDRAKFCPICGEPAEDATPVAESATASEPAAPTPPNMAMKIMAAPALLLGAFMLVVVVITYYAGVVVVFDSFVQGAPPWMGIVTATVLLVIGVGAFFLVRPKK
jgi:uncharacterized membrane protein YvbJ